MASARAPAGFLVIAMAICLGAPGAEAGPPPPAVDPLFLDGALEEGAYQLWKDAGSGFRKTEYAAWIVASDSSNVSFVEWPRRGLLWRETWKGPRPANVLAIIHTHPDAVDPRPSDKDAATARELGIPNYAVSRQGIWKATPEGALVMVDGEAWIVRCAGQRSCGVGSPSRALAERRDGRPAESGDGLP